MHKLILLLFFFTFRAVISTVITHDPFMLSKKCLECILWKASEVIIKDSYFEGLTGWESHWIPWYIGKIFWIAALVRDINVNFDTTVGVCLEVIAIVYRWHTFTTFANNLECLQ